VLKPSYSYSGHAGKAGAGRHAGGVDYKYGNLDLRKLNFIFKIQDPKTKTFLCRFCKKRNTVKQRRKVRVKANCDVDLAVDVLMNLEKFKRFIFLSGDGDFAPFY